MQVFDLPNCSIHRGSGNVSDHSNVPLSSVPHPSPVAGGGDGTDCVDRRRTKNIVSSFHAARVQNHRFDVTGSLESLRCLRKCFGKWAVDGISVGCGGVVMNIFTQCLLRGNLLLSLPYHLKATHRQHPRIDFIHSNTRWRAKIEPKSGKQRPISTAKRSWMAVSKVRSNQASD